MTKIKSEVEKYLDYLKKTQKLKSTLRHSWTEDKNRQESVAEHTWHMSLMAIAFAPELKRKVDLLKVLKMITVHDLGEAIVGEIPAFSPKHRLRGKNEEKALKEMSSLLPSAAKREILDLYGEYKKRESCEAIFTKMLDVIDVIFQHLIADISTWSEGEMTFNLNRNPENFFKKEPFMFQLYAEIHERLEEKVKKDKPNLT